MEVQQVYVVENGIVFFTFLIKTHPLTDTVSFAVDMIPRLDPEHRLTAVGRARPLVSVMSRPYHHLALRVRRRLGERAPGLAWPATQIITNKGRSTGTGTCAAMTSIAREARPPTRKGE